MRSGTDQTIHARQSIFFLLTYQVLGLEKINRVAPLRLIVRGRRVGIVLRRNRLCQCF